MKTLCVIPARLDSKRLPGKLLLAETGKPLICHTIEQALECDAFDRVVVASGDVAILEAATSVPGVAVCDTFEPERAGNLSFRNGTERVAHAAKTLAWAADAHDLDEKYDLVVGLQADEPMISAVGLKKLVAAMHDHGRGIPYGTIVREEPITIAERFDPNVVQASIGTGRAAADDILDAYDFRRGSAYWVGGDVQVHVGVYAWWAESLAAYAAATVMSFREEEDSLEQLRCVNLNWPCLAVSHPHPIGAVNTRADYDRFVAAWKGIFG